MHFLKIKMGKRKLLSFEAKIKIIEECGVWCIKNSKSLISIVRKFSESVREQATRK
jgi:hypothetical protein